MYETTGNMFFWKIMYIFFLFGRKLIYRNLPEGSQAQDPGGVGGIMGKKACVHAKSKAAMTICCNHAYLRATVVGIHVSFVWSKHMFLSC